MFQPKLTRSLARIFSPPFDGLWLVILLYFFWCFLVHPLSAILRGNLPDPDDYMYLVQVLDWLHGQNWFDNVQHRLNPPNGAPIHFSRFAQLLMAAPIWLLRHLGMTDIGAATVTAVIEPLVLFGCFFRALRWLATSFMPNEWSGVTAYVALFGTGMIFLFEPGHVDHHGLVILLVTLALGCAVWATKKPEDIRWAVGTGFIFALGLTVALEILPWLIIIASWFGLRAIVKGGNASRVALYFGQSLYISSAAFLCLTKPPATLFEPDILTYSIVYVILTASMALCFAGVAAAASMSIKTRIAVGVFLGTITAAAFFYFFPSLISGPYGGMNPALAKIMLSSIGEAKPLIHQTASWADTILRVLGPLLSLGAAGYFLTRASIKDRWLWGLIASLLSVSILLTVFYQYRFLGIMEMFAVIPLSVWLQRGYAWVGAHWRDRKKVFAEIGLLLLVGPLPMVLLPAIADGRTFNRGVLLFPVEDSEQRFCDMHSLEQILNDPALYGNKPHILMNMMGNGPELLFRTQHSVLSAPFHMNVEGNIDSTKFFATTDPAEAEAIVWRHKADLVVMCNLLPAIYLSKGSAPSRDMVGKIELPSTATFAERIMLGQPPKWLKRVHASDLKNYELFEVQPPMSSPLSKN